MQKTTQVNKQYDAPCPLSHLLRRDYASDGWKALELPRRYYYVLPHLGRGLAAAFGDAAIGEWAAKMWVFALAAEGGAAIKEVAAVVARCG